MTLPESFADRAQLQRYLAGQLRRGRLAFVLGAGISVPFGLPDWATLVGRMYEAVGDTPPDGQSLERQAEYLRAQRFARDPDGFVQLVQRALYAEIRADRWTLHTTKSLSAIATTIMACARHQMANVITFNFDDLIELYLEQHGAVAASVTEPGRWAESARIRIFHPHGLLPQRPDVPPTTTLVLDQRSFSQILGDERSPWRQELRSVLRTHTCLFIGLSGNDMHLDTLLNAATAEHAVLVEGIPYWGVRLTKANDVERVLWSERKVATWEIADYDEALAGFLLDICELAARNERRG